MTAAPSILVLGAGSIGTRHARHLRAAGAVVSVTDPDPDRAAAVVDATPLPFDLGRLGPFDGVVVASPTTHHLEHATWALGVAGRVLVEKPLASDLSGVDQLLADTAGRLMVGFNLRLHEPVERLTGLLRSGEAGDLSSVRVWFGSWLPDWRPSVDYRTTYSARADLGGGVLLDAIHELDLLVWIMGDDDFEVVGVVVDRLGSLHLDVEDTVKALLRHRSGVVAEVSLDYLSRRYRRGVEAIGDRATVRLDWNRRSLEIEDADGVRIEAASTPLDESYRRQAQRFVEFIVDGRPPPVEGHDARRSLALAIAIREAGRP